MKVIEQVAEKSEKFYRKYQVLETINKTCCWTKDQIRHKTSSLWNDSGCYNARDKKIA